MKTITIRAKNATITGYDYKAIDVEMDVNEGDLDSKDIAECVSPETYFESHSESEILEYIKTNYDWFDKEDSI